MGKTVREIMDVKTRRYSRYYGRCLSETNVIAGRTRNLHRCFVGIYDLAAFFYLFFLSKGINKDPVCWRFFEVVRSFEPSA